MTQETTQQESAALVLDRSGGILSEVMESNGCRLPIAGSIYRHNWPPNSGVAGGGDFEVLGSTLNLISPERSLLLKELETGQLWTCPWHLWEARRGGAGGPVWRLVHDPRDPKPEDLGGGC